MSVKEFTDLLNIAIVVIIAIIFICFFINYLFHRSSSKLYILYINIVILFVPYFITSIISNKFPWFGEWTTVRYCLSISIVLSGISLLISLFSDRYESFSVLMVICYLILFIIGVVMFIHLYKVGFNPNYFNIFRNFMFTYSYK